MPTAGPRRADESSSRRRSPRQTMLPGKRGRSDDQGARRDHDIGRRIHHGAARRPGQGARRGWRAAALLGVRRPVDLRRRAEGRADRRGRGLAGGDDHEDRRRRRRTGDIRGGRALGRREPLGAAVLHRHAPARGGTGGRGLHVRVRGARRRSRAPWKQPTGRTSRSWEEPTSSARRSRPDSSTS